MTAQREHLVLSQQSYQYVFTICTATYNRAYTLYRVYESLKAQTYREFEWLVIDDGSTDNTGELVGQWQKEAEFPIRYIRQENKGKHGAWNRGVREAKGELFLLLDSDDACFPNALGRFKHHWDSIPENQRDKFSGVAALCINQQGKLVGNEFPFDVFDSNSFEIRTKHQVFGEKWGFNRTEVMKRFPFPEISGEKYMISSMVWNRISLSYKTRFVNEKLRIYYQGMTDSITKSSVKLRAKNPKGARLYYQEYTKLNISLKWKVKNLINYVRFSFHAGIAPLQIILESDYKILTTMLLIAGFYFYKIDTHELSNVN